ncbi:MAG: carbohydrate ABC transporter permease [Mycoplasmatales bacterium]
MDQTQKLKLMKKRKNQGFYFVAPWLIGFFIFTLVPVIFSIYISMTDWGLIGPVTGFIGLDNYVEAFQSDSFYQSLSVTVRYAIWAVPLGMLASLTAALLLNTKIKGLSIFRGVYYLPVISSGVAIAVMWSWILSATPTGLMNQFLGIFNLGPFYWLSDESLVIPSYVIIATWGAFSGYLTYLVALRDIPETLYDSARISGIGYFERLIKITIPLMKPILIYNLIMAVIASFRKFSEAYILGGAGGEGNFYMVNFYKEAFGYYKMGYAVALAWILVIIVLALVALIYKQTPFWEYYSKSKPKKGSKK